MSSCVLSALCPWSSGVRPGDSHGRRKLTTREEQMPGRAVLAAVMRAAAWFCGSISLRKRGRFRSPHFEQYEARALLASVTITPSADNTLFQDQTSNSNGIGPFLFAGETVRGFGARRALVKFDVAASVPAGARIDSVTLKLHVAKDLAGSSADFGAYLVQANWGEGTSNSGTSKPGDGAPATTNDATWNDRFFPANAWASPGGDFNGAASATTTLANGPGFYQWSSAQLVADVQGWLNSPSTQFGWLIKDKLESSGGTAQEIDSRESTIIANRPSLTINYTMAAGPNQQPTLNVINDPPAILEDAAQQTVSLGGISAGSGET